MLGGFNARGYIKILTSIWICLCAQMTHAEHSVAEGTPSTLTSLSNQLSHYVVTISGGPAWGSQGHTQSFLLQPDIERAYIANNGSSSLGSGELFVGLHHDLNTTFQGVLGLAVAGSGVAKLSGDVWIDANPNLNDYRYTYSLSQFRLSLKGKLMVNESPAMKILQLYVSAGVGVGFNRAYSYTETTKLFETPVAPPFENHTSTAFTYTVGFGLQKTITERWQAGLGYEVADWGNSALSRAAGQTLNAGLNLGHFFTQELQLSLTYTA